MELKPLEGEVGEAGLFEDGRDQVDRGGGLEGDHGFGGDVAEEGKFVGDGAVGGDVGARDDDVGLDAHAAQGADGVLGGLGFELVGGLEMEERGDMDGERAVSGFLVAHLSDRFEEGLAFDVADGASDLDDEDVDLFALGEAADAFFDQVGDVGDGLDRPAKIVTASFAFDHLGGDLPHGDGRGGGQVLVEETFIVPEVEIGFGAVVGDVDLAVLVGGHGAGVDVEVGVELLDGDGETARLKESSK